MKTIALSMIFSLAVIVCEQQTLFAPHFISFDFQAPNSSNSLVPIAGVNRSVPLAGTSAISPGNCTSAISPGNCVSAISPGDCTSAIDPGDCSSALDPTAPVNGVSMYDHIRGGQEGEEIVDSYQFLPWHRG
jgi:hypothetical protein